MRSPIPLDQITAIEDPSERATAAVGFVAYAEARAREGRAIRDAALRACKERGMSKPQIAARTGVNIATVKAVLR